MRPTQGFTHVDCGGVIPQAERDTVTRLSDLLHQVPGRAVLAALQALAGGQPRGHGQEGLGGRDGLGHSYSEVTLAVDFYRS